MAVIGSIDAAGLLAHLSAEGLSKYDLPEYFIALDSFPLTPSGKILKRDLVEMVKRHEISPQFVRSPQTAPVTA